MSTVRTNGVLADSTDPVCMYLDGQGDECTSVGGVYPCPTCRVAADYPSSMTEALQAGALGCGWFTFPLGDAMEQINCYPFFDLGTALQTCFNFAKTPINQWNASASNAMLRLESMLNGDGKFRLDESRQAATDLVHHLQQAIDAHAANGEAALNGAQVGAFNQAMFAFLQALSLELGRAPIFFVTSKGVYDTRRLIAEADEVFQGYKDRLPVEALEDTKEAGRCLAFDLATAAGFHIARAIEAVIKQYMTAYNCSPTKDSQRNWGNYIRVLGDAKADTRVLHHLGQLKDLHRNPMTHPEQTLTMFEAQSLWAMGVSVIQAMVADMEKKRPDPSAAIVAMIPPAPTI